jgi:hypothetical protein
LGSIFQPYANQTRLGKKANLYLMLASFDQNGDLQYNMNTFFECLRKPCTIDRERWEVHFSNNITLNIHELKCAEEIIPVNTKRLFTKSRPRRISTHYMFWDNSKFSRLAEGFSVAKVIFLQQSRLPKYLSFGQVIQSSFVFSNSNTQKRAQWAG